LKEIEKDKRFINTQSINTKEVEKDRIKLYNHYTIFDRKIYLTTWTNEVKNLIKIEEFEEE
jgi:hypothetical protein